jgi:hypothetical protein
VRWSQCFSLLLMLLCIGQSRSEFIRVSKDHKGFVFSGSGKKFTPWGFNYDHDRSNRLLEYYWKEEWNTVVSDFREMKELGANTVRIHLQVSRFMNSEVEMNQEALDLLARLVKLAEQTHLYLNVTGLGCYDKADVPKWYNDLDEERRWAAHARFWEAVVKVCKDSPAIFCYDLMNEPVVTEDKKGRDWTPGAFGDRYFVQRLTLDHRGRDSKQIARKWVDRMVAAVRKHDTNHLVTIGVIPWAMTWPNARPLFYSAEVGEKLDFVSVHFYPKSGEVEKALKALEVYSVGKPIVIEEMFPLSCSVEELDQFIHGSKKIAAGWISFYWGATIAELKAKQPIAEATSPVALQLTLNWLEYFQKETPGILNRRQ